MLRAYDRSGRATPLLDRVKIWIGSGDEPGRPIEPHKGHIPFVFFKPALFLDKGAGNPQANLSRRSSTLPPPSCRSGEPTPPQRSPLLLYSFPWRQPRRKWSERLENEPPSAPCWGRISLVRRWIATAPRYVILCASTTPFTVGIRREMLRSPEIPKADNGRTSPPIYATHRWIGLDSLLDAPIAGDAKAEGEVGDGSGSGLRWLLAVGGCEWFDGRLGEGGA
ncbi:hypothetical protein GQ457_16G022030 [Hibiscus cannabinus]